MKRKELRYSVYLLLDGDKPFYVGVSSRKSRIKEHWQLKDATKPDRPGRKWRPGSKEKDVTIQRMREQGRELGHRTVAEDLSHDDALALEWKTVFDFYLAGQPLTNGIGKDKLLQLEAMLRERENAMLIKSLQLRVMVLERENAELKFRLRENNEVQAG